jgi:hypothetical protein
LIEGRTVLHEMIAQQPESARWDNVVVSSSTEPSLKGKIRRLVTRLPPTRMVLRGGYGIYYTRTTGQPFFQLLASPPYGMLRECLFSGIANALPATPPLPFFPAYSPSTSLTPTICPADFRPPIIQQYSTDVQAALSRDTVLNIGYHGSRGSKLIQVRAFDQAGDAHRNAD